MTQKLNLVFCACVVLTLGLGCSLITDFPDDLLDSDSTSDGTDSDVFPYSLESNITGDIEVTLNDDDTASVTLVLDTPLPEAENGDASFVALIGVTLNLEIQNNDSGVTANIKNGKRVTTTPDSAGEYQLTLNVSRDELQIEFYNETEQGQTLHENGNYDAKISVTPNSYFEIETFTRDVVVMNAVK